MRNGYRPEIDGLRAVAVVSVVLFHAGYSFVPGGFFGVDIFFVISGYLITGIIAGEIAGGEFSFRAFYARRARRILPALYLMLLLSFVAAWWLLTPGEIKSFSESVVATVFFVSNFLFMTETGYFQTDSKLVPLLHTWSLGVEEQYYLFAPLLLVIAFRFGRRAVIGSTAIFGLLSFGFALWAANDMPDWNFFLTPSRVWELMIGAMACLLMPSVATLRLSSPVEGLLSSAGLLLLVVAIFFLRHDPTLPGWKTLVPTIGAALVLMFASSSNLAGRALSLRPFVGIGLVSYSAYLFHQPLFAFTRLNGSLDEMIRGGLIAATFGLAYLSWRFVEQPFRRQRSIAISPLGFGLAGGALLTAMAVTTVAKDGIPSRFSEPLRSYFVTMEGLSNYRMGCNIQRLMALQASKPCQIGAAVEPSIVIWGDSHGEALASGLSAAFSDAGLSAIVFDKGGCMPGIALVEGGTPRNSRRCAARNVAAINAIVGNPNLKHVVLAGRWDNYKDAKLERIYDAGSCRGATAPTFETSMKEVACTLAANGKALTVFRQAPTLPDELVASEFDRRNWTLDAATEHQPFDEAAYRARKDNRVIDLLIADGIDSFDPDRFLCSGGECLYLQSGIPLYRDNNHLSPAGAALVGKELVERNLAKQQSGAGTP